MGSYTPTPPKPWCETPLVESAVLSRAAGCRIFLKLENLQPGASFKSRGIGNFMLAHIKEQQQSSNPNKIINFYISSGGNAGLACVVTAVSLGHAATVVLPTTTDEAMILKLKAAGATNVISHGDSWAVADAYLRQTLLPKAESQGETTAYVPPFDHPLVWAGASTMIDEIQSQMPDNQPLDALVCSVGGGGMFAGIMAGLERHSWAPRVLAVETHGADSLAKSIQAKSHITLPAITSIATSLGAVRVAEQAYKIASTRPNVYPVVLHDAEAAMGSVRFADDERMLVEPACGVSVALAYDGRLGKLVPGLNKESKVVIIVCGGARVSLDDLNRWRERYADEAKRLGVIGGVGEEERRKVPSSLTV